MVFQDELRNMVDEVCRLAREAGSFVRDSTEKLAAMDIEVKSDNNFVTWVDKQSEVMLVKGLSALLPGSGFIVEENTIALEEREYIWVVDPLDGTTNFLHGLPLYCVSIGLMKRGSILLGVVYEVNRDECFYAWKDGGAWLNGSSIHVSKAGRVKDSLIATGFPYYDYDRMEPYIDLFRYMMVNSRGLRRLGSAAADLAYVACGRFDGFFEYGLSPWDVAAGAHIVAEAGGRVSDFTGGGEYLFGKEILCSNELIYPELLGIVRQKMSQII